MSPVPGRFPDEDDLVRTKPSTEDAKKKSWEVLAPSLYIAGAIIIGTISAIYVAAGFSSMVALATVSSAAVYLLAKSQGHTVFSRWTLVMCMQMLIFANVGVEPMFAILGPGGALACMCALAAVIFAALSLA